MALPYQSASFIYEAPNFTITGPSVLALEGELRRQVTQGIKNVVDASTARLLRTARAGYPYQPMQSRFHGVHQADLSKDQFISGIATDDPVFPDLEFGARAHMPPGNRGRAGTGIESWLLRNAARLQGGHKRPLNVWLVQRSVAEKGNPARLIVTKAWEAEAVVFEHNLTATFFNIVSGYGA